MKWGVLGAMLLVSVNLSALEIHVSPASDYISIPYYSNLTISASATATAGQRVTVELINPPVNESPLRRLASNDLPFSITFSNMPKWGHRFALLFYTNGVFFTSRSFYCSVESPPAIPMAYEAYGVIRFIPPSGTNAIPRDINNSSIIVGEFQDESGNTRAFKYTQGRFTALPTLGGQHASALAINEPGQISGWSQLPSGETNACVWTQEGIVAVEGVHETYSIARDINDHGEIVGLAGEGGFLKRGSNVWKFPQQPEGMSNHGLIYGPYFTAETRYLKPGENLIPDEIHGGNLGTNAGVRWIYKANDAGTCVGSGYADLHGAMGLVYETRSAFRAERVGSGYGEFQLRGVNKWGQYVGMRHEHYFDRNQPGAPSYWRWAEPAAYSWQGNLNHRISWDPQQRLGNAYAINDLGEIICTGTRNGVREVFLLVPRPILAHSNSPSFAATITSYPGTKFVVEQSTNLTEWIPISTNTNHAVKAALQSPTPPGSQGFFRIRKSD